MIKKSKQKEKTIYAYIRCAAKTDTTIVLNTGEKLDPSKWNVKLQKAQSTYAGCIELEERLTTIKNEILKIHRNLLNDNPFASIEEFKKIIYSHFKKVEEKKILSFFEVYDLFLKVRQTDLSKASIQKFKQLKTHIENFNKSRNYHLSFNNMDMMFFDQFKNYLLDDKQHTNNTVHKLIGLLRIFMN
ncbi:MAG: integrase [Ignavibacteria bacterium]|nr:integrase [Ignavibacteria bacterium]